MPRNDRQPPFDPEAIFARIGDGRSSRTYGKGQPVFAQGDAADAVYYIQRGEVKVSVISEQGKEAIIAVLGPHDFFGEACLVGQQRRLATDEAMTHCAIVRL